MNGCHDAFCHGMGEELAALLQQTMVFADHRLCRGCPEAHDYFRLNESQFGFQPWLTGYNFGVGWFLVDATLAPVFEFEVFHHSGQPTASDQPQPSAHGLQRHHQRKRKKCTPQEAVPEERSGHRVCGDAGRVVVRAAGDQARTEIGEEALYTFRSGRGARFDRSSFHDSLSNPAGANGRTD
jgi:hypothetical protein